MATRAKSHLDAVAAARALRALRIRLAVYYTTVATIAIAMQFGLGGQLHKAFWP